MVISLDKIKTLRDLTGAGIMDCKKALEDAKGDMATAEQTLKQKGIARAASKAGRVAKEGVVEAYIHSGSRIGAIVEVNCETDFVGRLPEFRELAHNLSMQVAAMAPLYVDQANMPPGDERNPEEVCLMQQPFIRDSSKSIKDLVTELAGRVGENVRVARFARFALGE